MHYKMFKLKKIKKVIDLPNGIFPCIIDIDDDGEKSHYLWLTYVMAIE